MSDFQTNAPFPFYCERCGLVCANTAKKPIVCPTCASKTVHQYGRPPISVIDPNAHVVLQDFAFTAYAKDNLCPACKNMTLVFDPLGLMFD
jgi:RNA polymerase subunit RPABC4/transcription elongation factor Spt4